MLLQAAREHDISLAQSFMVGDKLADIEAGNAAGCSSILVQTGYGVKDEPKVLARFPESRVFKDLAEAVAWILRDEEPVTKNP
jgi:D-glycero-D-manno-heptose 1,7-bisphosphate phosphatase